MARSSSTLLTRYVSATTIVTADIANMWFGGLYNTTEGDLCDVDDPLVAGHVHDGAHQDGHAQKINLVSHVTSQLRNTNLADDAVNTRNVQSFADINSAVPISEMVDGVEHFFLDLSALSLATGADNLQEAWAGGNRIVVPDGSGAPVLIINNDTTVSAVTLSLVSNTNQIGLLVDQNGVADAAEFNGDVTINGKLTVTGLIDPTGLVLDHQATRPATPVGAKAQYWARNDDTPMFTTSAGTDISLNAGALSTTSNVTSNSPGTLATDDFVFGSASLLGAGNRFQFDKSTGAFNAGGAATTEWNVMPAFSVVFGEDNTVTGAQNNTLGGTTNVSGGSNNAILNASNTIIGTGTYNSILNGIDHQISDGVDFSLVSGEDNDIQADSRWCAILGGQNNTIADSVDYGTIIGSTIVNLRSSESAVIGSNSSTIYEGSKGSVIIGGVSNSIQLVDASPAGSIKSIIAGGSSNLILSSAVNSLVMGEKGLAENRNELTIGGGDLTTAILADERGSASGSLVVWNVEATASSTWELEVGGTSSYAIRDQGLQMHKMLFLIRQDGTTNVGSSFEFNMLLFNDGTNLGGQFSTVYNVLGAFVDGLSLSSAAVSSVLDSTSDAGPGEIVFKITLTFSGAMTGECVMFDRVTRMHTPGVDGVTGGFTPIIGA